MPTTQSGEAIPAASASGPPSSSTTIGSEPSDASITNEEPIAAFTRHLEYFGYSIEQQADGWWYAQHPGRFNLWLRGVEAGIRIHCGITIGVSLPGGRDQWLEFINSVNDRAYVGRFSLVEEEGGSYVVRVRALIPGRYDRHQFGIAMDMWHEDLGLLRDAPQADADEEHEESTASVTIN